MQLSTPKLLLHLEGLGVLAGACVLYSHLDYSWLRFGLFLLAPDVALLGLLVGKRFGVACYNAVHTYLAPMILFGLLTAAKRPEYFWIVLVWTAHIGMDRLVGYGLKYPEDPKRTHLHRV